MLTLKTKSVRFEWTDDDVESVVTLSSEDDQEALLRKLKRVIALVEGPEDARHLGSTLAEGVLRARADVVTGGAPVQTGNGWAAAYGPPEVPQDAEYELISEEEEA